jgi:phage shock protein PspC (stress-responsive transcriptional regulator)
MNTTNMNPESDTTHAEPRFAERGPLRRSVHDRMVAGVASGVAEYFGLDATIVRIAFVVLTVVGGAGIPLYLAGLLLIPEQGSDQSIAGSLLQSVQSRPR